MPGVFTSFIKQVDALLDKFYEHRYVEVLPAPDPAVQLQKDWILKSGTVAKDFTDSDAADVKAHFNGPSWRTISVQHLCLGIGGAECPSGCTSPAHGLEIAKVRARQLYGAGPGVPLAYRWKGMEHAAVCWQRIRGVHDIGGRAIRGMWDSKALHEAQAEADVVDDVSQLSFQVKTAVKAGAVIRSMNHDKDNIMCSKFQLLTQPMQEYLNKVQEADSAVSALVTAVAVDPSAEDTLKLRRKCIKLNKAVISGDVGRAMLGKYVELINDLDHPKWSLCGAHATEKNECILGMFRMLNDGWRRCVFYFEATRFLPFQTLVNPDDPWDFDGGVVEKLKSDLQSIQDRCQECLCAFAEAFLSLASAEPRLAHDTVEHALAFIRLGSAVVERAHLPGSELYKSRQRGVGPAALALGSLTYLKSSVQETAALAKCVKVSVFKNRGLTEQQFQRLSATHRVGGIIKRTEVEETSAKHRSNNVNKMMRALTGESKQRRSDAFREFRSRSWNVRAKVGSPAFKAEQQRIAALWETQKAGEERFVWDSYAGDTNHAISDLLGEKLNYLDITKKSGGVLSDSTGRALKRKLFLETSKEINEHQTWRRGLGIQDSCT